MNKNFHDSNGSSTHVRNPVPRWRIVFIVLALILVIGSTGQTSPVQAGPAGVKINFILKVVTGRSTDSLCVGDVVNIYVYVERTGFSLSDLIFFGSEYSQTVSGVRVEPIVESTNIVTISPWWNYTGWDSDNAGTAAFVLTAEKAGKTAIVFEGKVDHHWLRTRLVPRRDIVEDYINVKVKDCLLPMPPTPA